MDVFNPGSYPHGLPMPTYKGTLVMCDSMLGLMDMLTEESEDQLKGFVTRISSDDCENLFSLIGPVTRDGCESKLHKMTHEAQVQMDEKRGFHYQIGQTMRVGPFSRGGEDWNVPEEGAEDAEYVKDALRRHAVRKDGPNHGTQSFRRTINVVENCSQLKHESIPDTFNLRQGKNESGEPVYVWQSTKSMQKPADDLESILEWEQQLHRGTNEWAEARRTVLSETICLIQPMHAAALPLLIGFCGPLLLQDSWEFFRGQKSTIPEWAQPSTIMRESPRRLDTIATFAHNILPSLGPHVHITDMGVYRYADILADSPDSIVQDGSDIYIIDCDCAFDAGSDKGNHLIACVAKLHAQMACASASRAYICSWAP
jgi:hypothetical protein